MTRSMNKNNDLELQKALYGMTPIVICTFQLFLLQITDRDYVRALLYLEWNLPVQNLSTVLVQAGNKKHSTPS